MDAIENVTSLHFRGSWAIACYCCKNASQIGFATGVKPALKGLEIRTPIQKYVARNQYLDDLLTHPYHISLITFP
jgi:hypothetical protein